MQKGLVLLWACFFSLPRFAYMKICRVTSAMALQEKNLYVLEGELRLGRSRLGMMRARNRKKAPAVAVLLANPLRQGPRGPAAFPADQCFRGLSSRICRSRAFPSPSTMWMTSRHAPDGLMSFG